MCTEFLKPHFINLRFESSVISYGDKTIDKKSTTVIMFESSVISYGDKTSHGIDWMERRFESSVISYGDKTLIVSSIARFSLRVV